MATPEPLPAAALNTFAAAGAVAAAGTVTGKVTELVGSEQLPVAALEDADVMVEALVGRVFPPALVKVVEVAWMFHPVPDAVLSVAVNAAVLVDCWSVPFKVTVGIVSALGPV